MLHLHESHTLDYRTHHCKSGDHNSHLPLAFVKLFCFLNAGLKRPFEINRHSSRHHSTRCKPQDHYPGIALTPDQLFYFLNIDLVLECAGIPIFIAFT